MFFKIICFIVILSDLLFAGLIMFVFAVGGLNFFTVALVIWILCEWNCEGIMLGFRKRGGKNEKSAILLAL